MLHRIDRISSKLLIVAVAAALTGLTGAVFAQSGKTADAPLLAVVSPAEMGPCNVTDHYKPGTPVVFRIQIIDPETSEPLSDKDVSGVSIVLPNGQTLKAKYGTHEGSKQEFWVAHWIVPGNYPTGRVQYKVEVEGTSRSVARVEFAVPDQDAQLTIVHKTA